MALEFYVEQADRSPRSGIVDEDVYAGELVADDGSGVSVFTYADAAEHAGLARYDAQAFAREYPDEVREDKYVAGDAQRERAQYQPFEDGAVVRIRTAQDNETDPAPSIDHRSVVGVIDASGGTASSAAEFQGRVVEEGYTDNSGTTYDRSSSNFKAVGVAYRPARRNGDGPVSEFDYPVRVEMFEDPKKEA